MNVNKLKYSVLFIVLLISTNVYADQKSTGYYAGIAQVGSTVFVDKGNTTDEIKEFTGNSWGIYLGRKLTLLNHVYTAGEVFYHNSNLEETSSNGDKIKVDSQYGVKAHLGIEWNNKSVYGIIGISHYGYDLTQNGVYKDVSDYNAVMGLGASLHFNDKISGNIELMSTGDKVDIAGDQSKNVYLMSIRLGISYHF